jgi:vitamin K-dependent gamma-carboxylase
VTRAELLRRFDELLEQRVGTRSIAVVRAGVGIVALWLLWPLARDAWDGSTYHDRFHEPFLDALPHPSPAVFTVLVTVGVFGAAAMTIGLATRVATATTTVAVGSYLMASTTHLHNNRAYLFAILVGLSLAPTGRSWSVDRLLRRRLGRDELDESMPGWPLWLLRFECSLIYAASGFSKLIDPDWFGGTVTWGRVVVGEAMLRDSMLPDAIVDLLLERSFHTVAAKIIVLTELFIAGGLWWRRTRPWAVAVAVAFHISIEVSAQVQSFSYLALVVLFVWADPDLRYPIAGRRLPRVAA